MLSNFIHVLWLPAVRTVLDIHRVVEGPRAIVSDSRRLSVDLLCVVSHLRRLSVVSLCVVSHLCIRDSRRAHQVCYFELRTTGNLVIPQSVTV